MFNGGSTLIPSSLAFSIDELRNMIAACGLTTLNRLTPLLAPLLEMAQSDPDVLSMIKALQSIRCAGTPFPVDLGAWCKSEGLPIMVCTTQSAFIFDRCLLEHLRKYRMR